MAFEEFYEKYLQEIFTPFKHQKDVWDKVKNLEFPLLIKAPTGTGKTEAIIAPFLDQFITNNFYIAPRLIYVLPMRVLVNSLAERIKNCAQRISPFIKVEIQHGDVPNAPFFISDIVVTTLDQFLYGFARASHQVGHHLDIPAGSIASSLVVFDEAHMYRDEFTFSIMRALMEILYKSKIPFVLMTATMPKTLEDSLFEKIPDKAIILGKSSINSRLEVIVSKQPLFDGEELNIPKDLLDEVKNKKTLIVLNQVKRAQKVYDELKKRLNLSNDEIVLLHSRFTREDRKEHEEKALQIIPHKENGRKILPQGVGIVVSTQVLEAGIDFSAELLLTEIAPADCLVQRAGRCARYEGEKGEMRIFPLNPEDGKSYKPYAKEHIDKTFDWLKNKPNANLRNFEVVCDFVNILDYKANDFEATNTLIDLYECVLYADTKPENIQLREGKPVTLIVVDTPVGVGRKKEEIIKKIKSENFINVDIKFGWRLFKEEVLKYELFFDKDKNVWDIRKIIGLHPFKYYLLESNYYDKFKGVTEDEIWII